jgi:hypothetical protein
LANNISSTPRLSVAFIAIIANDVLKNCFSNFGYAIDNKLSFVLPFPIPEFSDSIIIMIFS